VSLHMILLLSSYSAMLTLSMERADMASCLGSLANLWYHLNLTNHMSLPPMRRYGLLWIMPLNGSHHMTTEWWRFLISSQSIWYMMWE
jgi:hypothetical protein